MNKTYLKFVFRDIFLKNGLLLSLILIAALVSQSIMVNLVNKGYFEVKNIYGFYFQIAFFAVVLTNCILIMFDKHNVLKILLTNKINIKFSFYSKFIVSLTVNFIVGSLYVIPMLIFNLKFSLIEYISVIGFYILMGCSAFLIQLLISAFVKGDATFYILSIIICISLPNSGYGSLMNQILFNQLTNTSVILILLTDVILILCLFKLSNRDNFIN